MVQNVLVTGAAGFIGGSVLADFISRKSGPFKDANFSAAVRSNEQVEAIAKLGVNVFKVDLSNEAEVRETILANEIDVVIATVTAVDPNVLANLIKGLGERRRSSGQETFIIHSSISVIFTENAGWRPGETKDSEDALYQKQRELGDEYIVRKVDLLVTEMSREQGVTSFIVPIPQTYGTGSGAWRKLSVSIPAYVRSGIEEKVLHKFGRDNAQPSVHISDLVGVYGVLVENILSNNKIPSGENGYYFASVHPTHWWAVVDRLAVLMHARGLLKQPETVFWPNYDEAAKSLGFPRALIHDMATNSGFHTPVKAAQLGWKPQWDEKRFMDSLDDEIQAVLDLDNVKPTLFSSLETSK